LTEPLGFDNTFAMLVRGDDARRLGLETLSDAVPHAPDWRPGFGYEFVERADGLRGLVEAYGLQFASAPRLMDLGLMYRALADGQVDIIAGNSTDGQIDALDLVHLEDDRHYFPPYQAVPIVRQETLRRHPGLRAALAELGDAIDERAMRRLNRLVDIERRDYRDVVREFLTTLQ
jgi:osmoprotectant transport system substrate-binding protein